MFCIKKTGFKIKKFMKKAKKYGQFESESYEDLVRHYESSATKVVNKRLGLKLVVISDTHGDLAFDNRFAKFMDTVQEYDLVVILGDIYVYELNKIGILGIEFTDEELQMNVADVFKNHNVSFITQESICEKYNISVARLKLLERKYISKSGMERKSRSKVLRDYLEE